MTIAAGFVVVHGVLLCADTLWTDGSTKEYRDKIFSWNGKHCAVCMAVSGNSDNARFVVDECRDAFESSKKQRLSVQDVLGLVRPIVRVGYENHVDSRPYEERAYAAFSMLIAIAADGQGPRLFVSSATSVAAVDRFECIGVGKQLARYNIVPSYRPNLTIDRVAVLGILALAATKEYVDGVGGQSQFVAIRKGFVSGIVPHDVTKSEPLALRYLKNAHELLLDITDGDLSEDFFDEAIKRFAHYARNARSGWLEHATAFRDLRESLFKPSAND